MGRGPIAYVYHQVRAWLPVNLIKRYRPHFFSEVWNVAPIIVSIAVSSVHMMRKTLACLIKQRIKIKNGTLGGCCMNVSNLTNYHSNTAVYLIIRGFSFNDQILPVASKIILRMKKNTMSIYWPDLASWSTKMCWLSPMMQASTETEKSNLTKTVVYVLGISNLSLLTSIYHPVNVNSILPSTLLLLEKH